MDHSLLKHFHISFALVSVAGFILRWLWKFKDSTLSYHRLTKTVPHVVDTLFLASGFMLAFSIGQYPFTTPWLTAKIAGLLAYIVLGMLAMSGRIPRRGRIIFFSIALLCFFWILTVARLKTPWGILNIWITGQFD